jgi:hypothetical protein
MAVDCHQEGKAIPTIMQASGHGDFNIAVDFRYIFRNRFLGALKDTVAQLVSMESTGYSGPLARGSACKTNATEPCQSRYVLF